MNTQRSINYIAICRLLIQMFIILEKKGAGEFAGETEESQQGELSPLDGASQGHQTTLDLE